MNKFSFIVVCCFIFINTGCLSLKEVNQYAAVSVASLGRINEVNYTFSDYCSRDCELRQMRNGTIDTLYNCQCTILASKADTTIFLIHKTVTSYLQAIEQLSNNQNFHYDASGLANSLQQNSFLKLSEQQTGVINKAGNILATAATAFYRKNQLKQYLEKADTVFGNLMETFIYLVDNRLRAQLRNDYETHLANSRQMLDNTANDKGLKQFIVKQSIDERIYYTKHIVLINCYVSLLRKIQEGHHQLYLQRAHLQDKNIKDLVKRYADDVQDIAATIKQ